MYTIEGKISLEDYQNANRLHQKPKGFAIFLRMFFYILIGISLVFMLFTFFTSPGWGTILPFLLLLALIVFMLAYVPYRTRKIYEQQKELQYPFAMTIDETGIRSKNQIGESHRPWTMFVKWREDKNLIMLYHSDVMFSMLAKRYLGEEALRFVKEQLQKNHIPEK